jgi:hypothetical protein
MTQADKAAIKASLKTYRELLPLLHAPETIKQVTDAIKAYELLITPSQP